MRHLIISLFVLAGLSLLSSCAKDNDQRPACQQLKEGITSLDKEKVRNEINAYINSLPLKTHTQHNLQKLVDAINQQCGSQATLLCFACIQTLPEESEIKISYPGTSGSAGQVIDISNDKDQKMIFVNMHD
jgi:hypothetical protein